MDLSALRHALEHLPTPASLALIKQAYEEISQAYRSGHKIILNSAPQQLAYLHARMPATVAVLSKILAHLPVSSYSLLDLGSGPGSVLWAAQMNDLDIERALCLDQSQGLLTLGKQLMDTTNTTTNIQWQKADLLRLTPEEEKRSDLVAISYVLNEISSEQQGILIQKAWNLTKRYLILVEPGTPKGYQNLMAARTQLIQSSAFILAPCTHEQSCPMSGQDWCHFGVRLPRSKLHKDIKGALPYEDEKYSYLIASRETPVNRPRARIVKSPLTSAGLKEFDLCDEGGLSRVKVSRKQNELYKKARKLEWGDGWV